MNDMGERMDRFETLLGAAKGEVGGLRGEVGGLRGEVRELRGEVGELRSEVRGMSTRVDGLSEDVSRLKVLYEDHSDQIRLIAEVQVHHSVTLEEHGRLLVELKEMVLPLHDMFATLAKDHERRLTRLEDHAGLP